jgi:hypothetical protein
MKFKDKDWKVYNNKENIDRLEKKFTKKSKTMKLDNNAVNELKILMNSQKMSNSSIMCIVNDSSQRIQNKTEQQRQFEGKTQTFQSSIK